MSQEIKWQDFLSEKIKAQFDEFKTEKTYIGIDFGTSTTVASIAKIDEAGELSVEHIPLKQKLADKMTHTDYRVSSALAIYENRVLIGKGAKDVRSKLEKNKNYWHSFKMELGKDVGCAYPESIMPQIKNPKDVASFFFQGLKKNIDAFIEEKNYSKDVSYAITVPASFESSQRKDLIECLNKAGIDVKESSLIDEPNAAFVSYCLNNDETDQDIVVTDKIKPKVLVFDFGAGTCDISILEVGRGKQGYFTKNISVSRYTELGGDNIDELIARDYLLPQLLNQSGKSIKDYRQREISKEIIPNLLPFAEKLKNAISEDIEVYEELLIEYTDDELAKQKTHIPSVKRINTRLGEVHINFPEISVFDFIQASRQFSFDVSSEAIGVELNPVLSAMKKSGLQPSEIDYVLFVGGSSKNIVIRQQLMSVFNKAKALVPRNLQSHVSKGAAVHSLFLGQFDTELVQPISNQSIFVMVETGGFETQRTIIESGVRLPFSEKEVTGFKVGKSDQKIIEIPFYLGSLKTELGVLKIESDYAFEKDTELVLKVSIDSNKLMTIDAEIEGQNINWEMQNPYGASANTVKEREIQAKLKDFNIAAGLNNGIPPFKYYEPLVKAYEDNDEFTEAAELLEEATENLGLKNQFNRLDNLFSSGGNNHKSKYYSEKALANNPSSPTLLFNLGYQFSKEGKREVARSYFEKAIEKDSNYPAALYMLAVYEKDGPKKEELGRSAFSVWKKRFENQGMRDSDYSWFYSCALMLGEKDWAKRIIEENPNRTTKDLYNTENLLKGE